MDMVGRLRENKLIVIGSESAPTFWPLLTDVNRSAGLTIAKSGGDFGGGSDHESFANKDIPILFFFTGTHEDYHTPTDTVDKINSEGEAKVLRLVADCAERIADTPERPVFHKSEAPAQPRGGFSVYFGTVPDYAAQVEGVQLNGVREGGPAAKAGLKAGDIIIKFGDRTIKNVYDYTYALQDHRPGDVVQVTVKRGTETVTLTATLAASSH
jgi:membrane-associated protease RseP (regulator of RpoE activity)